MQYINLNNAMILYFRIICIKLMINSFTLKVTIILPFLNLVLTSHLYTVSSGTPQTPVNTFTLC